MRFLYALLVLCSFPALSNEPLRLSSSHYSVHQLMVNGSLSDQSIDMLDCVLSKVNQAYKVNTLPWARAIEDLKQDASDGIFTIAPTPELDTVAQMSAPFALEKWRWYFLHQSADQEFSPKRRNIGVVRSSNVNIWLKQNGLKASIEVNNAEQLVRLLLIGRIDAFLEDEAKVNAQLERLGIKPDVLESDFSHYMPLGVYFSNKLLERQPHLLERFNQALQQCNLHNMQLSAMEQKRITELVRIRLKPTINKIPNLLSSLEQENQHFLANKITGAELDQQWFTDLKNNGGPLLNTVTKHPLSEKLRQIQADSQGLISEIYVTGIKGFNLAISQATSDFDQSDEDEFAAVILQRQPLYIDSIKFDPSSQHFQVKVAWPIMHKEKIFGIIVIGLDVEFALRSMERYFDEQERQ